MFHENENEEMLFARLVALRGYTVHEDGLVRDREQTEWIKFYLCGTAKLDMAYFYKAYDQMDAKVTHLIFFYTCATIQIKKLKVYKDVLRIEFFNVSELRRLLTGNRLIPRHVRVHPETQAQIVSKFGKENLPHILQSDPIVRLYDFPLESIVEIHRADALYYRLVVPDE